jgi:flagellar biosynthesis/type III secretory pathway protein FliH
MSSWPDGDAVECETYRLLAPRVDVLLNDAARKACTMDTKDAIYFSEAHRRAYEQGKAEGIAEARARAKVRGEAKGKAEALLVFLRHLGLATTSDQQHRILTCTDLATLDRWLGRVLSVASVDELLA